MPSKVFVSYTDSSWDIKTPFVSYSDEKFIQEINKKVVINNESDIVVYFKNRNSNKIKVTGTLLQFCLRANKKYKDRETLLELEDSSVKCNSKLYKAITNCFGIL